MALSNRVITTTEEEYVGPSIDAILTANVGWSRLFMRETKSWSGRQIQIPMQYKKPTSGGSFSGSGSFDTAVQDTRVRQTFEHAQFYQNVSIIGGEAALNKTDAEVLDLVKITMEEAVNAACDSLGDQLYDNGSGDDILGFGAIIDNGTNTSTYGGLTRSTYTQLNSTVQAATGGVLDFDLMATVFRGSANAGVRHRRPTIILSDETSWDLLESKYTPTINANYDALGPAQITTYSKPGVTMDRGQSLPEGHFGFECLRWRGTPIVADEKADSGSLFFVNENYLHWYGVNDPTLTSYQMSGKMVDSVYGENKAPNYPIQWTGLQKPYNQHSRVGQFLALGNVISGRTRGHGKATGITTT